MSIWKADLSTTVLAVVDIQERLLKLMKPKIWEDKLSQVQLLIEMLQNLDRPVLVTEQNPQGLGKTVAQVRNILKVYQPLEKTSFSCWGQADFQEELHRSGAATVILCGMEAHICIAETAFDLKKNGFEVIVPADAVLSSDKLKWKTALRQMEQAGIFLTVSESVLFHMLGSCEHPAFNKLIGLLKNINGGKHA